MAFFTEDFLNARRADLLRSVQRFQYQINGGSWRDGEINSKSVVGNAVMVFVNVPSSGAADTITGVRVYDNNDKLAGQHERERGAAALCVPADGSQRGNEMKER